MTTATELALRAYLIPLTRTRAFVIGVVLTVLFLGLTALAFALGAMGAITGALPASITQDMIRSQRLFILAPGIAIGAILLGELPLREGIRHRTLLYPLLGPVPRMTLAAVRILATGALLALGASAVTTILFLVGGGGGDSLVRQILAVTLGSFAFMAIFSFIHTLVKRGLMGGLMFLFLLDVPLAMLPFGLRKLSVTFQLRAIAGKQVDMELPVQIAAPEGSLWMGVLVLSVITVVFTYLAARIFKSQRLGELC